MIRSTITRHDDWFSVVIPAIALVLLTSTCVYAKPNVVIMLADDLGWGAVSYHSDWAHTPNIDQIAEDGIELDRFYVAPMCSPTRAGLMTGRYPIRFGLARAVIPPQRNFGLPVEERTLADALGKAGYTHRGIFGKWHLGHHQAKWHPLARGFTHFEGHYNGAIDYFDLTRDGERDWHAITDNHNVYLYKMPSDLLEKHNLADRQPEVVTELFVKLQAYRSLQPEHAVTTFRAGRVGFKPWKDWRIDPPK